MPSPGSRRRERGVTESRPVFGGCLTYLICLTTLIVLSVAAGGASYALIMAGAPLVGIEIDQGLAIGFSIAVVIGMTLWLNWLLRRWLGHSVTDFLDLLDLF